MLVQLSPWQTCSTSVSTRRRRKRSDASEASSSPEERPLEFEASFVTSIKRARQKKKLKSSSSSSSQEEPTVAITAGHRISIVGQSSSFQECSQWQYASRPGRTTAFVQEQSTLNGSKHCTTLSRIAAIFDSRNDKVYALQNQNASLACWNAETASGPGDADFPAVAATLKAPAVSLSTLPYQRGVAYGTCQDGSLYVARWTSDWRTLRVEHSEPVHSKGTRHLCTFVLANSSFGGARAGQKRKINNDGDFVFYQVFAKENGVLLYRREINLSEEDCLGGVNVSASFVDLITCLEGTNGAITNISALHDGDSTVVVVFAVERAENGKSMDATRHKYYSYCAPIELETGQLKRIPFALANYTRHADIVTPFILAVGTLDEVLLYDIAHGTVVHRSVVTNVVEDCKNWSLITDVRKGRLIVLSVKDGHASVSLAKATLDGMSYHQAETEGNSYSLAVGLRSCLASPCLQEGILSDTVRHTFLETNDKDAGQHPGDCVNEALHRLRSFIDEIQDPDNTNIQPFHFMNEYERSVISILSASPLAPSLPKKRRDLSKAQSKKNSPMPNGMHHPEASDSTQETEATSTSSIHEVINGAVNCLVNGLKVPDNVRGYTPSSLPQRFVDGAMSVVLSVLQLPQVENKAVGIRIKLARLDARLILCRLIRTGKVSARRHFDANLSHGDPIDNDNSDFFFNALRSLKLTKKGNNRVFSPVDLMHEMITWCPDISEGQMITMIHFMLCKALPEDIAENFLDHGNLPPGHSYRILAKKFMQVRSALRKQLATGKASSEDVMQMMEREKSMSMKLVRAGTTILVGRLVHYSRCNETLLCNAMAEGLIGVEEPAILSRVLVDLLNDRGKDTLFSARKQKRSPSSTYLLSKWIFTLCEACRDHLISSDDTDDEPSDKSPLSQILTSVRAELKNTETIMSLHDVVYQFGMVKAEDEKDDETVESNELSTSATVKGEATPIHPYSIERLAF